MTPADPADSLHTASRHDVLLVDLDGTVYQGARAIDGAVPALEQVRAAGTRLSYVTNNASRGPEEVARHLVDLGLTVDVDDVVTSAQAAAAMLAASCAHGTRVLVVGTDALATAVREVGLTPVRRADDDPGAVVQGHSPETGWCDLAEAMLALGAGAAWVACNVDLTLPTERGLLPGNGSLVAALRMASGREPEIAGKPAAPLLRQAVERLGAERPLVVGDRLDTDIAAAHAVDAESLLVLSGVSTPRQLLAAPPDQRPTYVAADLRVLAEDGSGGLEATRIGAGGPWEAVRDGEVVVIRGRGDVVAALRAVCAAVWDGTGTVTRFRGEGAGAAEAIASLDLPHG